ncbi:MAG TPA: bifunctional riboflavin kinase/FAD synthetase [bacterium]|nr:bifunctional riboflavin kinase/FAD synthetase [bacterium]HPN29720.1 bifunctional riboflavin kinase/FAD synthetase [bacterium]
MKISDSLNQINLNHKTVVTIGVFDGIHLGHSELIKKVIDISKESDYKSAVITFQTNPKLIFSSNRLYSKQLISFEKKKEIFEKSGVDYFINFNPEERIFEYSAEKFIEEILIKKLNAEYIVIGYDFKFGKEKKGNLELLKKYFKTRAISLDKVIIDGITVSSTNIKKNLLNYNFEFANKMLGYKYCFSGIIKKGKELGRTIGFPTINIEYPENVIELRGIFETTAEIKGKKYRSISHIGEIPTFNRSEKTIETYILNFNENVYGENAVIYPEKFIREIIKFNSIDELKKQIIMDICKI